jgi:hypothetical protein
MDETKSKLAKRFPIGSSNKRKSVAAATTPNTTDTLPQILVHPSHQGINDSNVTTSKHDEDTLDAFMAEVNRTVAMQEDSSSSHSVDIAAVPVQHQSLNMSVEKPEAFYSDNDDDAMETYLALLSSKRNNKNNNHNNNENQGNNFTDSDEEVYRVAREIEHDLISKGHRLPTTNSSKSDFLATSTTTVPVEPLKEIGTIFITRNCKVNHLLLILFYV